MAFGESLKYIIERSPSVWKASFCYINHLQSFDEEECFGHEVVPLNQEYLKELKNLYDYKCVVFGGERCFLLGLGVSKNLIYRVGKRNCLGLDKLTKLSVNKNVYKNIQTVIV